MNSARQQRIKTISKLGPTQKNEKQMRWNKTWKMVLCWDLYQTQKLDVFETKVFSKGQKYPKLDQKLLWIIKIILDQGLSCSCPLSTEN